jgi:hypothetical protein
LDRAARRLLLLGAHAERRRAIVAGALGGGVVGVGDLVNLLSGVARLEDTVPAWFMLAAAYGLGFALRGQRIQSSLLALRAERLEREREQQGAARGCRRAFASRAPA